MGQVNGRRKRDVGKGVQERGECKSMGRKWQDRGREGREKRKEGGDFMPETVVIENLYINS